jgi:hypothetical protein
VKGSGPFDTIITLKVLNESGDLIIEERGALRTWSWTYRSTEPHRAFVHRGGRAEKIPINSKVHTYRRVDVKAEDGWGSFFAPRRRGRYTVTLDAEPGSDRSIPVEVRLQMRGADGSDFAVSP